MSMAAPEVAGRDCQDCRKVMYDKSGRRAINKRTGLVTMRPPGTIPPCTTCPKIPPDAPEKTWEHAVDLSERNVTVYTHYLECKAVGRFPDDELVAAHARVIREVEDSQQDHRADASIGRLLALLLKR